MTLLTASEKAAELRCSLVAACQDCNLGKKDRLLG